MQNGMQNVLGSLTSNHIMKILSYKCLKRVFSFILDCRNDIKHDTLIHLLFIITGACSL